MRSQKVSFTSEQARELARGAEAVIYEVAGTHLQLQEPIVIVKHRPRKSYRAPVLDAALRKTRTRKEAKVLTDLSKAKIPAPRIIAVDEEEGIIVMSRILGRKLRDALEEDLHIIGQAGRHVSRLHDENLIHGDLTTSNMIIDDEGEVVLIDFGLSFSSAKIEDKAVDLHLLKQALASKHHTIADAAWKAFLKEYNPQGREDILKRLASVERRGRNKA